jgi:cytidine deaminase
MSKLPGDDLLNLTEDEHKLIEYAKAAVADHNAMRHSKGGIDTLYSFLISDSGQIYDGASFEPSIAHSSFCGERCAIANMVLKESYSAKIKSIVVADPVPEIQVNSTPPCGTCRHVIWQFGKPNASVILMQYIQRANGWDFPKKEKLYIKDLYPYPYEPIEGLWDNYVSPRGNI